MRAAAFTLTPYEPPQPRRCYFTRTDRISPRMKALQITCSKLRQQLTVAAHEKGQLIEHGRRQEQRLHELQRQLERSQAEICRLRQDYIPRAAINSIAAIHGTRVRVYAS